MITQSNTPTGRAITNSQPLPDNIETKLPLVLHTRVVSGNGGGPDKTILNSPGHLGGLGYQSRCLYFRDPRDAGFDVLRQRATERQVDLIEVDDFGLFDWRIVQRTRAVIEQLKPAVWHGHDYKSNLLGLWMQRYHPMKLVTTVHGWVQQTWKTPLYYAIDRRCLPRYDQVICVSNDLFRDCQNLGVKASSLSLIDNAIHIKPLNLPIDRRSAKAKLGVPTDRPLVIGVGRLSSEKGFDVLIRAVADLNRNGRPVSLAIAGQGDQFEILTVLIKELGCGESVRLLGFVSNPELLYEAADLFVLSSHREGLPNVVLEAMAAGTPVLATNVAGMPTLIEENRNGRLVEPGSERALKTGIDQLLIDPTLRDRLAKNARKTIESRFEFGGRMQKIAQIYDRLSIGNAT